MDSINMPSPIDLEGGDGLDGGSQDVQDVNTSHSTAATGMENQDEVLSTMSQRMLKKFHKYWKNYSVVLAMTIVLDPRYKLIFVEFCYKKLDESTCDEKVANVRVSLNNLFQEYAKQKASQSSNQHSLSVVCHSNIEDDISEFDHYEDIDANNRSELDLYLEEPKVSRLQHANMDILGYWKDNQGRYPILSMMARDLMSMPITTVASESAFSIGAKVLTKYRSSITPENAEALICTSNWLFQYECESDEPSDEQLVVPIAIKNITESRGSNA